MHDSSLRAGYFAIWLSATFSFRGWSSAWPGFLGFGGLGAGLGRFRGVWGWSQRGAADDRRCLLIRGVLAGIGGGIGGVLPIIGGVLLIWRVLAGLGGGIGGVLPMIGGMC